MPALATLLAPSVPGLAPGMPLPRVDLFEAHPRGGMRCSRARTGGTGGDELCCALGRARVATLDISRNLGTFNLIPIACLDTPGMAQGLALRGAGSGRQLLVGDSRSGMRLYGRVQEE